VISVLVVGVARIGRARIDAVARVIAVFVVEQAGALVQEHAIASGCPDHERDETSTEHPS
jgi:hypothetical protein